MLRDYIFEIQDQIKKNYWTGTQAELDKIVYEDYEGLIDFAYEKQISVEEISHEIVQRFVEDKKGLMDLQDAAEILKEIKVHYK